MWYVYLLYSKSKSRHYVGSTDNLVRRLHEHNTGRSTYTSFTSDWFIEFTIQFETESEARMYEKLIKKNKKHRLKFYNDAKNNVS